MRCAGVGGQCVLGISARSGGPGNASGGEGGQRNGQNPGLVEVAVTVSKDRHCRLYPEARGVQRRAVRATLGCSYSRRADRSRVKERVARGEERGASGGGACLQCGQKRRLGLRQQATLAMGLSWHELRCDKGQPMTWAGEVGGMQGDASAISSMRDRNARQQWTQPESEAGPAEEEKASDK